MALVLQSIAETVEQVQAKHMPALTVQEQLADELITCHKDFVDLEMEKTTKRIAALKKELQATLPEVSEEPISIIRPGGVVNFSKPSNQTVVTKPVELLEDLADKFGQEAVLACVNIKLTEVRKFYSELEFAKFTDVQPGGRTCKVSLQ